MWSPLLIGILCSAVYAGSTLAQSSATPSAAATLAPTVTPSATATPTPNAQAAPSQFPLSELAKDALTVVNLLLVWFIFSRTRKQQRIDRTEDREYRKQERADAKSQRIEEFRLAAGNFWIQRLILEPNRQFIDEFFDRYEQELRRTRENTSLLVPRTAEELISDAKKAIREFKTEFYRFRRRIVDPLCWISKEFDAIRGIAREIDDLVTGELGVIPGALHDIPKPDENEPPAARLAALRASLVRTTLEAQSRYSGVPKDASAHV